MDFYPTEEQKQLKELVKQFCKREVDPKRLGEIEETISRARTIEEMREYAKQRIVGGKPLIQHTSIAAKQGEIAISLEALMNLGFRIAWELDQQEKAAYRGQREINLFWAQSAGAFGKQIAWRFCEIASDIYGGLSGSLDFHLEGFMRNTFMTRAAGLTVNAELIQTCWEYDDRYQAA